MTCETIKMELTTNPDFVSIIRLTTSGLANKIGFSIDDIEDIEEDKEKEIKAILTTVYDALRQKGYNPINQIVGYILSEDPTYVTTHNNARSLIRRIDRDELLQILVKTYLND